MLSNSPGLRMRFSYGPREALQQGRSIYAEQTSCAVACPCATGDSWGMAQVTQLLGHPETRLATKTGGITWGGQRVNDSGHLEGTRVTQQVEPILKVGMRWWGPGGWVPGGASRVTPNVIGCTSSWGIQLVVSVLLNRIRLPADVAKQL
jgi:hypothetical protein